MRKITAEIKKFLVRYKKVFLYLFIGSLLAVIAVGSKLDIASWLLLLNWIMTVWLYRLEDRNSFWLALINLCFCPILLIFGSEDMAENFAIVTYLFLCVGAVQGLIGLREEKKLGKELTFNDFLIEVQKSFGVKKKINFAQMIADFRRVPKEDRKKWIIRTVKENMSFILGTGVLFTGVVLLGQILEHLKFVWWLFGRAYIMDLFPQTLMMRYDLIFGGCLVVLIGGAFIIWRKKINLFLAVSLGIIIGANIVFDHQSSVWSEKLAGTPLIFEIHEVGGESDPQIAIRGAVFGEIQGKGSRVLYNGQEMDIRNWSNNTVVVDKGELMSGEEEGEDEDLFNEEKWEVIDSTGTESKNWSEILIKNF